MLIIGLCKKPGRDLKLAASRIGGIDVWIVNDADSYLV
jgi:hypothetical protein